MKKMDFFLEDRHADIHLIVSDDGESYEYHWRNADGKGTSVVLSCCPDNYPAITVCTMTDAESNRNVKQLLKEGLWMEAEE